MASTSSLGSVRPHGRNVPVHDAANSMAEEQTPILAPSTPSSTLPGFLEGLHIADMSASDPAQMSSPQSPPQILKAVVDTVLARKKEVLLEFDDRPRAYASTDTAEPLFNQALFNIEGIRFLLEHSEPELATSIISSCLQNDIIRAVYSSNYIERTGLEFGPTESLCRTVFTGYIPELQGSSKEQQAQRETFQHAQAFLHILHNMVVLERDLSEELILSTHRILLSHVDLYNAPWQTYAGKYRKRHVHAGTCNFTTPTAVPRAMAALVESYNADVAAAKEFNSLDPFTLAAKYCNDFVMIHPFLDGNGRMCRLILNAILLKYASCIVSIGGDEGLRSKYIAIQRRAGEEMEGSPELAELVLEASMKRLRVLKKKLAAKPKSSKAE
jgi:fido (protein-threonine AMPylation protein)